MVNVICTRENASELINGIAFQKQADGSMMAVDVPAESAELFAEIDGYTVIDDEGAEKAPRRGRPPKERPLPDQA